MGAIKHGVILVHRRIGFFATEHQARNFGGISVTLRQQLVDAGPGANFAAGCQRGAGEQIAGLRTVDITLLGFLIV